MAIYAGHLQSTSVRCCLKQNTVSESTGYFSLTSLSIHSRQGMRYKKSCTGQQDKGKSQRKKKLGRKVWYLCA
ncbi:rCG48792 [Rattus norvegicus]|uniref:RCG48792 n=1 Tax=Rattus norvegicus TaxID=10116 RepID=A6IGA1_RAT|nr:rCG48792 [Rattus norvegicus]